jgi:DNA-binding NtrC family response regulator
MLGESPEMKEVTEHLRKIAPSMAAVMLVGESGTGKEVAAELLHAHSTRGRQAIRQRQLRCDSGEPGRGGALRLRARRVHGAVRQHQGYFERAKGGTLFLDEITEMPIDLQARTFARPRNGAAWSELAAPTESLSTSGS